MPGERQNGFKLHIAIGRTLSIITPARSPKNLSSLEAPIVYCELGNQLGLTLEPYPPECEYLGARICRAYLMYNISVISEQAGSESVRCRTSVEGTMATIGEN